jgi:hypothetical protein
MRNYCATQNLSLSVFFASNTNAEIFGGCIITSDTALNLLTLLTVCEQGNLLILGSKH